MWVYRTTDFVDTNGEGRVVLFDFTTGRGGENPRRVLQGFCGTLVTDDFSGYHALAEQGVTPGLRMAHARRKLFEAHKLTGSPIAGQAVMQMAKLYEIEREAKALDPQARLLMRHKQSRPAADALREWLIAQRLQLAKADATAKAIDYTLSNWRFDPMAAFQILAMPSGIAVVFALPSGRIHRFHHVPKPLRRGTSLRARSTTSSRLPNPSGCRAPSAAARAWWRCGSAPPARSCSRRA